MRIRALPRKLRLSLHRMPGGLPVRNVILRVRIELRLTLTWEPGPERESDFELPWTHELTALATDHVGYVSFSLSELHRLEQRLEGLVTNPPPDSPRLLGVRLEATEIEVVSPFSPSFVVSLFHELQPPLDDGSLGAPILDLMRPQERVSSPTKSSRPSRSRRPRCRPSRSPMSKTGACRLRPSG